jgi:molybdopterin synthase catalytic subunit
MIRVQREDFDIGAELDALTAGRSDIGGLASFTGLVRDFVGKDKAAGEDVSAMTLEHYPGMTEKRLAEIEAEANKRWPLSASLIIHRYGKLTAGERIVLVACAAAHREDAFAACQFLMDWLKTSAPFWKQEDTAEGPRWVEADAKDDALAARWKK